MSEDHIALITVILAVVAIFLCYHNYVRKGENAALVIPGPNYPDRLTAPSTDRADSPAANAGEAPPPTPETPGTENVELQNVTASRGTEPEEEDGDNAITAEESGDDEETVGESGDAGEDQQGRGRTWIRRGAVAGLQDEIS